MSRVVLMSIKPQFAERIFGGTKGVELRRLRLNVDAGDVVVVYASAPVSGVVGAFVVGGVVADGVRRMWNERADSLGVTREEYDAYFEGASMAYGIVVGERVSFAPVSLRELRERVPGFSPPQSYSFWGGALDQLVPPTALGQLRHYAEAKQLRLRSVS